MNKKLLALIVFLLSIIIICFLVFNSDKNEGSNGVGIEATFDADSWRIKEGNNYPHRSLMVDDILYNDTVRSLSKNEIIDLLGEPDRINEDHLYYLIDQTQVGAWPLKTKTLVIKIAEDNTIDWIKTHG